MCLNFEWDYLIVFVQKNKNSSLKILFIVNALKIKICIKKNSGYFIAIKEAAMKNISRIHPFESMLPWKGVSPGVRRKKNRKNKPNARARRNFSALSELVDDNHLNLISKQSPFRLCVYREKEKIFMDVVTLDETKKIDQIHNRTITHYGMGKLVRQIQRGMGLILDYSV